MTSSSIDVLFDDGPALVVNKPAGLSTQAPPKGDSLEHQVKSYLKERFNKPGNVYLGVPHRLDRDVSGAVLFARNSKAARRLAEQFRDRKVAKIYWALVEGQLKDSEGTICQWIRKVADLPVGEVVGEGADGAKRAVLDFRVLGTSIDHSLVEVSLITGRFHQIRIQLSAMGHPVVGDALYGSTRPFEISHPAHPIALHARSLEFLHPIRYDKVKVNAPLPDYWSPFLPLGMDQISP